MSMHQNEKMDHQLILISIIIGLMGLILFIYYHPNDEYEPVPNSILNHYSSPTKTVKKSGLMEGCSVKIYELTRESVSNLKKLKRKSLDSNWSMGKGMLKIVTWGCGLAFYDNGGGRGFVGRLYDIGEGLPDDEIRYVWNTGEGWWHVIYPERNYYMKVYSST